MRLRIGQNPYKAFKVCEKCISQFPTATPLDLPPSCLSALRSNDLDQYEASSVAAAQLAVLLVDHEQDTMRLKDLLAELEIRKKLIAQQLREHRSMLSPIRKLPPDVLIYIFSLVCAPLHETDPGVRPFKSPELRYGGHERPFILSGVSTQWRSVVIDRPSLWSCITFLPDIDNIVPLSPLQLSLTRSQGMPLQVYLVRRDRRCSYQEDARLMLMEEHAERIELLHVYDRWEHGQAQKLDLVLPNLRDFTYDRCETEWSNRVPVSFPFLEQALLQRLSFYNNVVELPDSMGSQIGFFRSDLRYASSTLNNLSYIGFSSLTSAELSVDQSLNGNQDPIVTLPLLISLKLEVCSIYCVEDDASALGDLLEHLVLPSLTSFSVLGFVTEDTCVGWSQDAFATFVEASGISDRLESFSLAQIYISNEDLLETVRILPGLTYLSLDLRSDHFAEPIFAPSPGSFLSRLVLHPSHSPLLPSLTRLKLSFDGESNVPEPSHWTACAQVVSEVVRSRLPPLRELGLSFTFDPSIEGRGELLETFEEFRSQGLYFHGYREGFDA